MTTRPNLRPLWGWFATLLLLASVLAPSTQAAKIIELTSQEFYEMATATPVPLFNLMIDVRTEAEWNTGHIENATLRAGLQNQLTGTTEEVQATLKELNIWNCRFCTVVVYCRSGARAGAALTALEQAGFIGTLYNGLGVSQWTAAGYELVTDPASNEDWPCMKSSSSDLISSDIAKRQAIDLESYYCQAAPEDDVDEREQEQQMILQELEENKALFVAQLEMNNATSYSFLYNNNCFCPPQGYPWLMTVELQHLMMGMKYPEPADSNNSNNNETTNDDIYDPQMLVMPPSGPEVEMLHSVVSAVATSPSPLGEAGVDLVSTGPDYLTFFSMMDLFDIISSAVERDAASINVVYHPVWGYPESIAIDYVEIMADEETYIFTSNFTVLSSSELDELDEDDEGDMPENNSTFVV